MGLGTYILISAPLTIPALVGLGYLTEAVFNIDNCGCDVSGTAINQNAINLLKTLPTNVFAAGGVDNAISSIPTLGTINTVSNDDKRIKLSSATLGLSKMGLVVLWMCICVIFIFYIKKIF